MISPLEMLVTAETGQMVRLSRYTDEQFSALFPLDESNFTYVPTKYFAEGYGDPQKELEVIHDNWSIAGWGIFASYDGREEQMVGDISLATDTIRERGLDTRVARVDARSRGIGTLAKAALVNFAFRHTGVVRAVTANPASKVSLSRLGFVNCGQQGPPEICGHERVPMARDHFLLWNDPSDSPARYRTGAIGGRRRFDSVLQTLQIAEAITWPND